jgi:DNA-binding transcriptional LysR family regulator
MPTDAGMRWYLLIGEMLKGLGEFTSFESLFVNNCSSFELASACITKDLLECLRTSAWSVDGTLVTFSFFSFGCMQNLRIFTNDFLSFYFLEPLLEKFMNENQLLAFSTFGSESQHLSDFDFYFLPHELPLADFSSELVIESRLGLYAHPSYIEKYGSPKNLVEIEKHTMVRNKACRVIQSLGMDKYKTISNYKPLFYKKSCIEFDTYLSMLRLCEKGFGIMPGTEVGIRKTCTNLHKLPSMDDEGEFSYFRFTFGWHHRHNDSSILRDLSKGLSASMLGC